MRVKRWLMGMVLMLCITTAAHAILPVAGLIAWLSIGTAAESAAGIAASVAVNTGIIAAFALSFWKKDESNKPTGSAPTITVYLNPSKARENPDPAKFDDPASGARDVTPKATTSGKRDSTNTPAGATVPVVLYCFSATCAGSASVACTGQPKLSDSEDSGRHFKREYVWTGTGCGVHYTQTDGTISFTLPGDPARSVINNVSVCPGTNLTASAGK